ncbi:MAG: thiamine pyrophosphate-dependent enzyme, partial [Candidatus Nanopelagicales bacterium]
RPRGLLHESPDPGAWFASLAKAVFQPTSVKQALDDVAAAIETALSHPRGPVYLGVPSDVLASPSATGRSAHVATASATSSSDVAALADIINASSRPILWVGGGAVASDAGPGIDSLAWRLGAPVICTYAARGLLPSGHPLLVEVPVHEPAARELLASADLLIGMGSGFDGMTTANWTMPRPDRVVDINLAPSHAFRPDLVITADVQQTVDAVSIRLRSREPWADSPFRIRADVFRAAAADPRTREAVEFVQAIDKAWPSEQPIVCDMAVAGYWVGGYAAIHHPRHLLYPVGWGTLGYGLPAAIGVAAAGQACLAVVGDGGLSMALGELATIGEHHLPVTLLVVDDNGYGMLRFDQQRAGVPERGVDLESPRWTDLGRAFDLPVDKPGTIDDLGNVLAWSALSGEPRMIVHRAALYPPRSTSPRWADADDSLSFR